MHQIRPEDTNMYDLYYFCITGILDWQMNEDRDIGVSDSSSGSSDDEHEVFQMMEIHSILLDPYR